MTRTVGLVGVGAMGRGFATNLIASGFEVRAYDRDPERLAEVEAYGAQSVASPAETARDARWVLTSLPEHGDVSQVVLGPLGIAQGARPDLILIDTSTSLPQQSRALAAELAIRGVRFIDASVSGTGATVMQRDVIILAGGDEQDFAECLPVFEGISRRAYYLGPVGSGALGKLAVNVAVVGNRLAMAEALTFGISSGMDPVALLDILKDGASYSRAMDLKGEKMIRRDYRPESTLGQSVHGCDLLLEEGRNAGAPMFLTSLYAQIAQVALRMGHAGSDPASIIEALFAMAGNDER